MEACRSQGTAGLLLPEQGSPRDLPLAGGLGHCLSSLVDLAPER